MGVVLTSDGGGWVVMVGRCWVEDSTDDKRKERREGAGFAQSREMR